MQWFAPGWCSLRLLLRHCVARELIPDEHETGRHQSHVGGKRVPVKVFSSSPKNHDDQDCAKRQKLSDLHAHIERNDVRYQSVARQSKLLQFRSKTESMEEAEDQHCRARIRLKSEETLEGAHVVERFVHDRKADDRVHNICVNVSSAEHSIKQCRAVAECKKRDILADFAQAVEEEDHSTQKQKVIVTSHHVLRAEIEERNKMRPAALLQKRF